MAHGSEKQDQPFLVTPHMGRFGLVFCHPDRIPRRVESIERGQCLVELVAQHENEIANATIGLSPFDEASGGKRWFVALRDGRRIG